MNLSDSLLYSFVPRIGKEPLCFTFPKTWKQKVLSGNVWPTTTTDRSVLPAGNQDVNAVWNTPSNWTSIKNISSNLLTYWRYKNEFVGNSTNSILPTPSPIWKCYTFSNGNFNQNPSEIYIPLCSNLSSITEPVYFPVPLVRLNESFKPDLAKSKISVIILNQGTDYAIPDVSKGNFSEYQLFSITGLKLNIPLERNESETLFRTRNLPAGVYLLLVNTENKFETLRIIVQ